MNEGNKLKLNSDKSKFPLLGSHLILGGGITQMLDGVAFPLKAHICSLGFLLDPELLLGVQVKAGVGVSITSLGWCTSCDPF